MIDIIGDPITPVGASNFWDGSPARQPRSSLSWVRQWPETHNGGIWGSMIGIYNTYNSYNQQHSIWICPQIGIHINVRHCEVILRPTMMMINHPSWGSPFSGKRWGDEKILWSLTIFKHDQVSIFRVSNIHHVETRIRKCGTTFQIDVCRSLWISREGTLALEGSPNSKTCIARTLSGCICVGSSRTMDDSSIKPTGVKPAVLDIKRLVFISVCQLIDQLGQPTGFDLVPPEKPGVCDCKK